MRPTVRSTRLLSVGNDLIEADDGVISDNGKWENMTYISPWLVGLLLFAPFAYFGTAFWTTAIGSDIGTWMGW